MSNIAQVSLVAAEVVGTQNIAAARVSQVAIQVLRASAFVVVASGGVATRGFARVGYAYKSVVGSPSIHMGGGAHAVHGFLQRVSGGLTTGGHAFVTRGVRYNSIGNLSMGGMAKFKVGYKAHMLSGVHTGGGAFYSGVNHRFYRMYNGEVYTGPNTFTSTRGIQMGGAARDHSSYAARMIPGGLPQSGGHALLHNSFKYHIQQGSEPTIGGHPIVRVAYPTQVMKNVGGGSIVINQGTSAYYQERLYCRMSGGLSLGGGISGSHVTRKVSAIDGTAPRIAGTARIRVGRRYHVLLTYIRIGGSNAPEASFFGPTTGGITIGGASGGSSHYVTRMSGGVVCSGKTGVRIILRLPMSGGILLGGSNHIAAIAAKVKGKGGIRIGGAIKSVIQFRYASVGGPILGGTVKLHRTVLYTPRHPTNRLYIFGSASYSFNNYQYTAIGGIEVGNNVPASVKFCAESCSGVGEFFREFEGNPGCVFRYNDPLTGLSVKKSTLCSKMQTILPLDIGRRQGKVVVAAQVAAITVCQNQINAAKTPQQACFGNRPL